VSLEPSRTYRDTFTGLTGPLSITVPSHVPPDEWETEPLADEGAVVTVNDAEIGNTERVEIVLDATRDYEISCAVIGLNEQPAYQPPSSSGSGGGGGSGEDAYSTFWLSPASEPGTSSCDSEDCTYDASTGGTLTLTADTDPTADGATVEFAVNDTSVATVMMSSDTTGSNGEASTELDPDSNGIVKVYAASGGSGDAINVTVTNAGGGGGNSLRSASVENLGTGDSQQDLTFTLDRDLTFGETVTIDLSDPQAPNQVEFHVGDCLR
jgi:hypothetical protein